MSKAAVEWSDARLNALAAVLEPVPTQLGVLGASVAHVEALAAKMEPLPAQLAVLSASVERLVEENRVLRAELAAAQRQLLQMWWGLAVALLGVAAAIIGALL